MSLRFCTHAFNPDRPIDVAVFATVWGWAAIAVGDQQLCRVFLPQKSRPLLQKQIRKVLPAYQTNATAGRAFQRSLQNYFQGKPAPLDGVINVAWATTFAQAVLKACVKIRPGTTLSYGELATKAGFPKAARAVGGVMACNRLPLIIPCHRVVAANGALTGYSAPGGIATKKRLLEHEQVFT